MKALPACLAVGSALAQSPLVPVDGRYWLRLYELDALEWDVDGDGDGMSNRQEYYADTDPLDVESRLAAEIAREGDSVVVSWDGLAGSRYDFLGSATLDSWISLIDTPLDADGSTLEVEMNREAEAGGEASENV